MLVRFKTIRKDTKVTTTMRSNTVNIMAKTLRKRAVKEIIGSSDTRYEDKSDTLSKILSNEIQSVYSKHRNSGKLNDSNFYKIAEDLLLNYLKVLQLRNKFQTFSSKSGYSSDSF